ncbi:uncharacterized protein LOC119180949 [Rhipicephalus microplus]|uniref:uncharacterized protein LOC119180949 n=1 Tax=Rhipicephalus microplus TaxID=6941 RepID=UPI003F6B4A83
MERTCPPGYGRKGSSCELCPASTYGHGVCLPCPPNSYNLKAGSAYCDPCPPGAYVGGQCHPVESALPLSLLGLVFKCGFITTSVLSLLLGLVLIWLKARSKARFKGVPTTVPTSSLSGGEVLYSRVPSSDPFEAPPENSSSHSDCDAARLDAVQRGRPSRTSTTKTSSSSNRTARARVVASSKGLVEGAPSDDRSVWGDGAGGDASSPTKRRLILKRVEERGAGLPDNDVDIAPRKEREVILDRLKRTGKAKWALGGDNA